MKLHLALLAGALATASPALASGPWVDKGFWRMNEATGNAVASSVPAPTGTATNAAIVLNSCNAGSNCRSFNGSTSHVTVPYGAVFDPGGNDLRYSAFVKPALPRPANGDDIIHVDGYPNPHFKLEISEADSIGKAKCGVRGSALKTVAVSGGPDLYDGLWHNIECRVIHLPSNRLELWVDGTLRASVAGQIGSIVTGTPMLLGKHSTVEAGRYSGRMDDVRIRWATP